MDTKGYASNIKQSYSNVSMTFIQNSQHLGSSMFHELQEKYLKLFLSIIAENCNCVHFVGDRCDVSSELSLRGEERERRSKISCRKMIRYKPYDTLAIPDWKSVVTIPWIINNFKLHRRKLDIKAYVAPCMIYVDYWRSLSWSWSHSAAVCGSCIPAAWVSPVSVIEPCLQLFGQNLLLLIRVTKVLTFINHRSGLLANMAFGR